jgi:6-phosphogluconate dehydrogenase
MQLGFVGLGRMGANMVRRLARGGHQVVAYDRSAEATAAAVEAGARGVRSLEELAGALAAPRAVWLMVPAGGPVDATLEALSPRLGRGDVVVEGGNSYYRDSMRRAAALAERGVLFVDAGTSGGVWGLEQGYCLMVGGAPDAVALVAPALRTLAPHPEEGWRHVGPPGAGHFVKMIHNGVEYAICQAYGEGFELMQASEFGLDLPAVARLWNRGSVVRSWLLELAERALRSDPRLERIRGYVEDSGMGRWTAMEAIERAVPAPTIVESLFARFRSRQADSFGNRLVAALRNEFGGHAVKTR